MRELICLIDEMQGTAEHQPIIVEKLVQTHTLLQQVSQWRLSRVPIEPITSHRSVASSLLAARKHGVGVVSTATVSNFFQASDNFLFAISSNAPPVFSDPQHFNHLKFKSSSSLGISSDVKSELDLNPGHTFTALPSLSNDLENKI